MTGYQVIDLKNRNLTSLTTATISGVYEAIEGNYRKPILLDNIVIDSVEKDSVFIELTHNGSTYSGTLYGYIITISDSDQVNIKAN